LRLLSRLLLSRVFLAAAGAATLVSAYQLFGPRGEELGFMRRTLTDRVVGSAAADLPRRENVKTVAVLDLPGDANGFITTELRRRVADSGKYELIEDSFFRKLLREFGYNQAPVSGLREAVAAARNLGVDAVVFGEVPEFKSSGDAASLALEIRMAERESGQAVFAKSYRETATGRPTALSYWRARMADSPKGTRILVWVLFATLLPLLLAPVVRWLAGQDSNTINLAMLVGLTLVDLLAAWFLTGFWIPTLWSAAMLVAATAGGGYYNYRVATAIDEMAR
jgi:hypothetical protein